MLGSCRFGKLAGGGKLDRTPPFFLVGVVVFFGVRTQASKARVLLEFVKKEKFTFYLAETFLGRRGGKGEEVADGDGCIMGI